MSEYDGAGANCLLTPDPEVDSVLLDPCIDLLGETCHGELVHIEIQSTNDPGMLVRMAKSCLSIFRKYSQFPRQIVLYCGDEPMSMETQLNTANLEFEFTLVDARRSGHYPELETSQAAEAAEPGTPGTIRLRPSGWYRQRVASLRPEESASELRRLLMLSGLRKAAARKCLSGQR